jgi:hypothetical protein
MVVFLLDVQLTFCNEVDEILAMDASIYFDPHDPNGNLEHNT